MLNQIDGRQIWAVEEYPKLRFQGKWPSWRRKIQKPSNIDNSISIQVSYDRKPEAIAKEIFNRLLPIHFNHWFKAMVTCQRLEDNYQANLKRMEKISEIMGIDFDSNKLDPHNSNWEINRYLEFNNKDYGIHRLETKLGYDNEKPEISLSLLWLPEEIALKILNITIKELATAGLFPEK